MTSVIVFLGMAILHRKYRYSLEAIFGTLTSVCFFLLGIIFYCQHNQPPELNENGTFSATVLEKPEEKPNSYKTILKINYFFNEDSIIQTNEKIIAYFEKNHLSQKLAAGTVILLNENPRVVTNSGNPYEFDYKTYLNRKKIYRQVYLTENNWTPTNISANNVVIIAERLRERLLAIYRQQNLGENETAILSALTLGYKRGLDPETKRVFSAAGAMHVLAVSGLHVGIIFGMFILLFGFLKRSRKGKIIFVSLSILLLWSYALLTGLSPSVMRAATMFSLVSIATNLNRRANIYNTLATSAFILLLINPNNIFEVGFQLSYSAVFGIVFLQPKLEKLWPVKNKICHYIWVLITVSVSAQIATFPFTSYYFHQFPSYFIFTNIMVIPAVFVLIVLGVLLLLLSGVPFISTALAFATKQIIDSLYLILQSIENLPHSVLDISLDGAQSVLLIFALLFGFSFIEFLRLQQLKYSLLLLSLVLFFSAEQKFQQRRQNEIIVYNNRNNATIQLITGRQNYVITELPHDSTDYSQQLIQNVVAKRKLNTPIFLVQKDSFEDKHLLLLNNIICFEGKTIQIEMHNRKIIKELPPDFLILNSYFIPEGFEKTSRTWLITSRYLNIENEKIHSLPATGAFQFEWMQ